MAGRPAVFRNAADKQRAYRERKKAYEHMQDELLKFVAVLDEREIALRNYITYWQSKGKTAEIKLHRGLLPYIFAAVEVNGHFNNTTDSLLCEWLIAKGSLELIREDWSGKFYQFRNSNEG